MCLQAVIEHRVVPFSDPILAYKVFEWKGNGYLSPYRSNLAIPFSCTHAVRANAKTVWAGNDIQKYETGFHCFRDRGDAEWLRQSLDRDYSAPVGAGIFTVQPVAIWGNITVGHEPRALGWDMVVYVAEFLLMKTEGRAQGV